ncbi:hypothetical protein GCM10010347_65270 [Streptomyces cirratus]|uniref:Phage tail sheath protein n=1 Tax=Streptomyces cirratus TaxID=68187 RepID=A0ABQ3F5H2_9ACTN|nr:phage tail sheath subtilisin-like domain-containing protein [Streptomyces cirratus]GHB85318.1 hypothetical protein GCM10010347_65270 [Streptomyces cirratus]
MAARLITGPATSIAAFIGHLHVESPRKVGSWTEFTEGVEDAGSAVVSPYLADAVYGWFANGGGPCWIAGAGEGGPFSGYEAALEALAPEVTIVVAPDLWETRDDGAVIAKAVAGHCVAAGNRMALLHTAQDAEPAKVPALLGLGPEEARFTTVYYPWLKVPGDEEKMAPPCGHVAGIWARTDAERGVHRAPANTGVRGALGLQRVLTDEEQGEINGVGVNCLRVFPGQGLVVWGARTLATDDEWKYLSVRRLASFLRSAITDGTRWAAFEPVDEHLLSSVRASVTEFLMSQWRAGALPGKSPEEAFYVTCDETNNPASSTEGTVVIDVGFAPVRPAEFTHLRVTQQAATQ